jgi:hypothetical protein
MSREARSLLELKVRRDGYDVIIEDEGFQIRDYGPKLEEVGVFIKLADGSEVLIPEKMMRAIVKSWSEV